MRLAPAAPVAPIVLAFAMLSSQIVPPLSFLAPLVPGLPFGGSLVPPPSVGFVLPAGVTVQALDGETCSSSADPTTCTHNYYSRNGYTYLAANSNGPFPAFDSSSFFPVEGFYGIEGGTQQAFNGQSSPGASCGPAPCPANFYDVGLNATADVTANGATNYALMTPNGVPAMVSVTTSATNGGFADSGQQSACTGDYWVAGFHVDEADPTTEIATVPNSCQSTPRRLWDMSGTSNYIIYNNQSGTICHGQTADAGGGLCMDQVLDGGTFATPNSTTTSVGAFAIDVYWFAWSPASVGQTKGGQIVSASGGGGAALTQAQMARAKNYGNIIDWERAWSNGYDTPPDQAMTLSGASTSSNSVTVTPGLGWIAAGMAITDVSSGLAIGTIQSFNVGTGVITLTANATHSASAYDMVQFSGGAFPAIGPAKLPISNYIENYNGNLTDTGVRAITPQEINWAVGTDIVHGARLIEYFANGVTQMDNTTAVGGITVYNQIKATNANLQSIARVLNSPFALGYVSASPGGYAYPQFSMSGWLDSGIGVMAKVYNGHFYVFATYDGSEADSSIAATFTIKDTGVSSIPYALFGTGTTGTLTASAPSGGNRTVSYIFTHSYDVLVLGPI